MYKPSAADKKGPLWKPVGRQGLPLFGPQTTPGTNAQVWPSNMTGQKWLIRQAWGILGFPDVTGLQLSSNLASRGRRRDKENF